MEGCMGDRLRSPGFGILERKVNGSCDTYNHRELMTWMKSMAHVTHKSSFACCWLLSIYIGKCQNDFAGVCKGTSIHSLPHLFFPTLPLNSPCSYVYPPHLCTISRDHTQSWWLLYPKADDLPDVNSPKSLTFHSFLHSYLSSIGWESDALGQAHMTKAPSAVMWMPIYGRLGTRRLGTVILSISFVVWPS
jgi:hypothetical protein